MNRTLKVLTIAMFLAFGFTLWSTVSVAQAETYVEQKQQVLDTPAITSTGTKLSGGATAINWTKVTDAQGYYIYRSSSEVGGYKLIKKITSGATTRYEYTGIKDGTVYYYKIIAFRIEEGIKIKSRASEPVEVVQKKLATPSITSTGTMLNKGTTAINWTKIPGAQGYYIYRSSTQVGGYKLLKTVTNGATTRYAYTGVKDGTTYYYKVIAYHIVKSKAVKSKASSPVEVIQKRLGKVEFIRSDVKLGAIKVTWDKVSGAEGYYLYRSNTPDGGYKKIATTKKTTFLNSGLKDNKLYYYKAIAYHRVGKSIMKAKASSWWEVKTPIRVRPGVTMSVPSTSGEYMYIRGKHASYNICISDTYCDTTSHYFYGSAYVYVPAGAHLNVSVDWYEASVSIIDAADVFEKLSTRFTDGEYIVGFDIQPGTYAVQGMGSYSYTICNQPILNCELSDTGFIDSDYVYFGDIKTINLQEGQFINIMSFGKGVTGLKID